MKDIPHHMEKFIKNFTKKQSNEEVDLKKEYQKEKPLSQIKKQEKASALKIPEKEE